MDIHEYFAQKEREFEDLSLVPDREYEDLFAEAEGSNGRRGRIFGNLSLAGVDHAFLAVSERVVVVGKHVRRLDYAYYLVIDGVEIWGYERDPTHDPPVHRHTEGHAERIATSPVAFRRVVELAWQEISERALVADE
jgi:hypothetical protein